LVLGCLATAFTVTALVYAFADVSGAHFNPAVTFAAIITQKTTLKKGFLYILFQLIASCFATTTLLIVFPKPTYTDAQTSLPQYVTVNLNENIPYRHAFCMEFMLTFIMVYVGFACAFDTLDTHQELVPLPDGHSSRNSKKYLTIYVIFV
jgi:glycerol uptake facilitator-like aquaporin